jgi:hypothetical protein
MIPPHCPQEVREVLNRYYFLSFTTQLHVCSCVVRIQMYENYQNKTRESVRNYAHAKKPAAYGNCAYLNAGHAGTNVLLTYRSFFHSFIIVRRCLSVDPALRPDFTELDQKLLVVEKMYLFCFYFFTINLFLFLLKRHIRYFWHFSQFRSMTIVEAQRGTSPIEKKWKMLLVEAQRSSLTVIVAGTEPLAPFPKGSARIESHVTFYTKMYRWCPASDFHVTLAKRWRVQNYLKC